MALQFRLSSHGRDWLATVDGSTVTIEGVDGQFVVTDRADGQWSIAHGDERRIACGISTKGGAWTGLNATARDWQIAPHTGPARHRVTHDDGLRAPMSATVVKVHVSPGMSVEEGDPLVVVEAMKMEIPIRASRAGLVKAVFCREGDLVQPELILVELE